MSAWNNIYETFDPIAFTLFSMPIHWYGIMYVLALLSALYIGKYFIKKDKLDFKSKELDSYFLYVEIGVILGARLGYILFYDTQTLYYISHPWQIFNPFVNGEFVGIRGMSYHGAVLGFLIATYMYSKKHKIEFGKIMDLVAISVPLAFVFGRIGNFLNKELIGRETDVPWGILVDGILRHPSQLYEAILEGFGVFVVVYAYRRFQKFSGELILVYGMSYGLFRAIAEIWRAPDAQIGYICCNFITFGQALSLGMSLIGVVAWLYFKNKSKKRGSF
ncbi:MAG: prolipoprotein diacylglyceryl transferase [Sulfurimonas sp. RIFCSPHIGHO2_12_FULL_36_9]|uniref:prolipoprotein diacylglyceryl transferase n=1 Tax=Sulfurimonas sp. RIFCSPLOWO2_12_36_12 TaxID=1802253 RepID=UPI0008BC6F76|nr:prolipoprotein diacylglyceryl transferase [Sulfurimonas sp. RIFCSPLOWO2_12_36_12]OHD99060.1 MAG: prolipoprotein diacylglyceryl transferase [Sulfurimonas sp. RIFCSPHIGHO2_12_FULL_36_9]OHE01044.1 MAG: prolipoprotein diacylglyceryl transferase [Sulfurimonas sp. RIFCSPLOWO2_12_36_12]